MGRSTRDDQRSGSSLARKRSRSRSRKLEEQVVVGRSELATAILLIRGADQMTVGERSHIAWWLKAQARKLMTHGSGYSPLYSSRYYEGKGEIDRG